MRRRLSGLRSSSSTASLIASGYPGGMTSRSPRVQRNRAIRWRSRDDWNPGCRRLQHNIGKALPPGGQNHQIHGTVVGRCIGNKPGAMYARMTFDPAAKTSAQRVFSGIEPTHEQQMRFRFDLQNGVESLHQFRQPFVAGQPANKAQNGNLRGKAELVSHAAGAGRESFHIDPVAAAMTNQLQLGRGRQAKYYCLHAQAVAVGKQNPTQADATRSASRRTRRLRPVVPSTLSPRNI